MLQIEVPRQPQRTELLATLDADGFEARPLDELGIEVGCDDCTALVHELERWIAAHDVPLVPIVGERRIVLRPPGD